MDAQPCLYRKAIWPRPSAGKAATPRNTAGPEPSRQVMVHQACFGRPSASSLALQDGGHIGERQRAVGAVAARKQPKLRVVKEEEMSTEEGGAGNAWARERGRITRGNVSTKRTPAKARAEVSGVQMHASTLNENTKRSVTGPRNRASIRLPEQLRQPREVRRHAPSLVPSEHLGLSGRLLVDRWHLAPRTSLRARRRSMVVRSGG
jgi:hypothetical protein